MGHPPWLTDGQCASIRAWEGRAGGGSLDGALIVVTAWKPDARELAAMAAGAQVFLAFVGGLPPHLATTSFEEATHPV